MEYHETVRLKDGRSCVLRHGDERDAQAVLDCFLLTHEETDFMLTYPDECTFTVDQEAEYLLKKRASEYEVEILAELDGRVVGTAGFGPVGTCDKLRHRADFGIGIERAAWGLGIGRALTRACIECARQAGYAQMELNVQVGNVSARALYESEGFVEYGRNPRGFRTREGVWQELVYMRLELDGSPSN